MPTLKETEVSLSYVQCFLYLVSSINVSIFLITWMDAFWTDLICVWIELILAAFLSFILGSFICCSES